MYNPSGRSIWCMAPLKERFPSVVPERRTILILTVFEIIANTSSLLSRLRKDAVANASIMCIPNVSNVFFSLSKHCFNLFMPSKVKLFLLIYEINPTFSFFEKSK